MAVLVKLMFGKAVSDLLYQYCHQHYVVIFVYQWIITHAFLVEIRVDEDSIGSSWLALAILLVLVVMGVIE